jgi:hypothetical protein
MVTPPSIQSLRDATGISQSYASMILADKRAPSRSLAIHILRRTGWRHRVIAGLSDDQLATLEAIEPWSPRPAPDAPTPEARAA